MITDDIYAVGPGYYACNNYPSASVTITANPNPFCQYSSPSFTTSYTVNNPGGWIINSANVTTYWKYVNEPASSYRYFSTGNATQVISNVQYAVDMKVTFTGSASCIGGTGTFGGDVYSSYTITAPGTPVADIINTPPAICAGGSITYNGSASNYTSLQWQQSANGGATWTNIAGETGLNYTRYSVPASDNNYQVRLNATLVSACSSPTTSSAARVISVSAPPALAINGSGSICYGSSSALTVAGASTYTWSPATGLNTTTGAAVTASPTTTTTYTVTGTSAGGCTASSTQIVYVTSLPVIAVSGNNAACNGATTPLTATGATTYTWSPATGLSAIAGSAVNATPPATTTYTITGTDVNGCKGSATKTLTINALPAVAVSGNNSVCSGSSTPLTASGASSYTWSPATALSATTGTTVSASPTTAITYTVTGTDANGCKASANKTLSVNALPVVAVSGNNSVCSGSSTPLTATGTSSYAWSPATGLSAATGSSVNAAPATTTLYTITGTDLNGCKGTTTKTITVNALPAVAVSGSATTCSGIATPLTASGASSYTWSPATALSATTGTTVSASPTTAITYTVTGTDLNGCAASATKAIAINPALTLSIAGPAVSCSGRPVTLTAGGASTYSWTPGGNATAAITVTPATATTYTVSGTAANGCTGTKTITVTPSVKPAILPDAPSICQGQSVVLTGSGGASYRWLDDNSTTSTHNVAPAPDSAIYRVAVTAANGCTDTAATTVYIYKKPVITAVTQTSITCAGGNTGTITVTAAAGNTPVRYRLNSGAWQASGNFTGLAAGSYTVSAGNANATCNDTTTPPVVIVPNTPIVSGINGPSVRCANEDVQFMAAPPVTGATYAWSATGTPVITNGAASSNFLARWDVTKTGTTQTVTLVVTSAGCSKTYSQNISISGAIYASAGPSKGMCPAGQVTIGTAAAPGATGTTPGATYNWTPAQYVQQGATSDQAIVNPPVTTIFTLTVTDPANGCTTISQVTVNVSVAYNPVADAGADTALAISGTPNTLVIGGPATTRPGAEPNTTMTYLWTALSAAPISALSNTAGATPVFTRPAGVAVGTVYKYVLMVQKKYTAAGPLQNVTCPVSDTISITFKTPPPDICISAKAFLEGPLTQDGNPTGNGGSLMRNDLAQYGIVPLSDPYAAGQAIPDFLGSEVQPRTTTAAILARAGNAGIVDWVAVQLRDAATNDLLGTIPALLQRDGRIVDAATGTGAVCFPGIAATKTVRIVILHRNHLAIASSQTFNAAASTGGISYDFSTGLSKAYNNGAGSQMVLRNGSWAMWGANADGDGFVDSQDKNPIFQDAANGNLFLIYKNTDVNMDGFFDGLDQNFWIQNNALSIFSDLINL